MDEKAKQKEIQKQRDLRKKRLIIRNLSFKASEEDLRDIFSKYGNVLDVTIPLMENKRKRGFAFVQFDRLSSLIKAMKALNYKEVFGRPIAIDYAVDKTKYQKKMQENETEDDSSASIKSEIEDDSSASIKSEIEDDSEVEDEISDTKDLEAETSSEEDMSDSEKRVKNFFKEFDAGAENNEENRKTESELSDMESDEDQSGADEDQSEDSQSGEEESSDSDLDEDTKLKPHKKSDKLIHPSKKKTNNDINEGKTVFLRNVSFVTEEEDLQEALSEYGEFEYCLLCVDKLTDHPKGTAFVKFKNKEDAEKLIDKANEEPGIFLDGRRLQCSFAISRDTILTQKQERDAKHPKDKRNLHLLKVGAIVPNSEEAEGVSERDMKKRAQLEIAMRQKLRNLNFFIADKRLVVHNIPSHLKDFELRKIFKKAAPPKANITECRIMKDFKKVGSQGSPASKGFGFVCFSQHEDALAALEKVNNNPKVFTSQKRPIVEFSIENQMALQAKERRKEKSRMINKKKAEEAEKLENHSETQSTQTSATNSKNKRKRKRQNKPTANVERENKKSKNEFFQSSVDSKQSHQSSSFEKKSNQKKIKKNQKSSTKSQNEESFSDLFNKYKSKLINTMI